MGTFRSSRTSTLLPRTSPTSSRVLKVVIGSNSSPPGKGGAGGGWRQGRRGNSEAEEGSLALAYPPPSPPFQGGEYSDQPPHRSRRVDHAVGETPFIIVPAEDAHQLAL